MGMRSLPVMRCRCKLQLYVTGGGSAVEFLLVNTNGGGKWTFPKGAPETSLSHSQAAEREAGKKPVPRAD